MFVLRKLKAFTVAVLLVFLSENSPYVLAGLPTQAEVDVYSSLCKIGSQTTYTATGDLDAGALFGRRILSGEAKLSGSKIQNEFPGINDEENRIIVLQSFQDCMYRYVEKFHGTKSDEASNKILVVGPETSDERRREIVYLANELESFKIKMKRIIGLLPEKHYNKQNAIQSQPTLDPRLIGLSDYSNYKPFASASGGMDFSNMTNNDIALLCDSYDDEIDDFKNFSRSYRDLNLPSYSSSREFNRICTAAKRGR